MFVLPPLTFTACAPINPPINAGEVTLPSHGAGHDNELEAFAQYSFSVPLCAGPPAHPRLRTRTYT